MTASALAAVTPFEVVSRCKNDKTFGRIVEIVVGQTGNFFLRWSQSHGFWASVEEAVFLNANGLFGQLVAEKELASLTNSF